ncbi:DUF167 domain-containing protein, partial [Patescibacteria group bacterium]|nr:DUF167 domain-containing protein [Patescibacteria group bacterium]
MKIIHIKVIPNAKKNEVLEKDEKFRVYINAPAVDGKANKAMIKVLAEFLKIKKNDIKIIKGEKSREKI